MNLNGSDLDKLADSILKELDEYYRQHIDYDWKCIYKLPPDIEDCRQEMKELIKQKIIQTYNSKTNLMSWRKGDILPTHYTEYEGGEWKVWKGFAVIKDYLDKKSYPIKIKTNQASIPYDDMYLYYIHSLAFADPALGAGNFPRWDVVNGWTTDLTGKSREQKDN